MLRAGTANDADRLLAWRNDPTARAMSGDTRLIDRETHVAWLTRKLADPDSHLFIAEAAGDAVGYIRFDRQASGAWEVSIAVPPAHRGRGLAGPMLTQGCALIQTAQPQSPISARVRPENTASHQLFLACGFIETGRDSLMVHYTLPPETGRHPRIER